MNEKKIIAFIVEGVSEEAALGTIMKEYFTNDEIRFIVIHGDITLSNGISKINIIKKINEKIKIVSNKYGYKKEDFLKIIHIIDTDGAFILPEIHVILSMCYLMS